jgi:hypothetical protein
MKIILRSLLLFSFLFLAKNVLFAQVAQPVTRDTVVPGRAADTLLQQQASKIILVTPAIDNVKAKLTAADPGVKFNKMAGNIKSNLAAKQKSITDKLNLPANSPVKINLTVEDAERYQPLSLIIPTAATPKYLNVFSVHGNLMAWGVPLNLDFSTDRSSYLLPGGANNRLFKFDFDPRQFGNLATSDLDSYKSLKNSAFGGLNFTDYAKSIISQRLMAQKLAIQQSAMGGAGQNPVITKYLNDPQALGQLLTMSDEQIRQKLKSEATAKATQEGYSKDQQISKARQAPYNAAAKKINDEQEVLKNLLHNQALAAYLHQPQSVPELRYLDEIQIEQKLIKAGDIPANAAENFSKEINVFFNFMNFDLAGLLNRLVNKRNITEQKVMARLAKQVMLSTRQGDQPELDKAIKEQQAALSHELLALNMANGITDQSGQSSRRMLYMNAETQVATDNQINTFASTITDIKDQLHKKGYDADKMLLVQKYLGNGGNQSEISEVTNNLLTKKPAKGMQSVFSRLDAFKIGSFGNNAPGGVQNQDVFMNGAHVTLKSGTIPVTFGYGSVNDINSSKDANYQSSVYNQPRSLTYISADLKRGPGGNIKISVISSLNREVSNSLYAIPTVSANNVAVTVSKSLNMGNFGSSVLDVSKSTTVYSNKFQPGSEAILDQKGGLKSTSGNDLFQALSVGFTHHLDIQELNASDNLYFNYAGMGYQNPANNGYGGAQMKFGGSIKKYFYNNKLTVNLRSDLSNIPISYTSSDRWKTYLFQLDTRYVFGKHLNIALKYTANGTDKKVDGISSPVYNFQKIQFDGNSTYKIGHYYSISHFSLGEQAISNSYMAEGAANLLLLSYTQSVVIKQNSVTANIFYNKELSAYKLIGDLLNSDVAYQYMLLKTLSMSSGVTYLSNTGIARQAGVRQGVTFFINTHFNMESYIDLRKNMITPLYPDLYASCRAEFSLKYHFSN